MNRWLKKCLLYMDLSDSENIMHLKNCPYKKNCTHSLLIGPKIL